MGTTGVIVWHMEKMAIPGEQAMWSSYSATRSTT